MRVMKFGGTSVRDAERIGRAADLVVSALERSPVCVVVSALGGVTDELEDAARASARGESVFAARCAELAARHTEVAAGVAEGAELEALRLHIEDCFDALCKVLEGISLVRECSLRTLDKVLSVGERLSSAIVAAALRRRGVVAEHRDSSELITADRPFGAGRVDFELSYEKIRSCFADHPATQVVTGFLAATPEGETITLGRGGSDYTASLLGAALEVECIEIWTDVDGVLSCDPRHVPEAFPLEHLSYDELLELSHFGAKVVFSPAVHPARSKSVPLLIKNTLNPDFPGTRVEESVEAGPHPIRGISAIPRVALLRLQGDGLTGVPGAARRLFSALSTHDVNIILISQASSEHSICLAIEPAKADQARSCVNEEFTHERSVGLIDDLVVDRDLSVVAVVGEGMSRLPGVSGRVFGALGEAGINVRAIAQGSSELNISFACAAEDEKRVLRVLHDAFFSNHAVHIFLAGVGGVGGALLDQLRETADRDWSLSGIANSRRMSVARRRLDPALWVPELLNDDSAQDARLHDFRDCILDTPGRRVFVDCTASDDMEELYPQLLRRGVSIVTANKKPLERLASWDAIRSAEREGPGRLFFEATAGAGLPVVRTVQDQLDTGDVVRSIEGLFSGTLGFLMTELRAGKSFSAAVREAHERGFTEPDPREDLGGLDVSRKLVILARLAGARLELGEVRTESLVPADWFELSLDEFWEKLPELDDELASRVREADEAGRVLTYLATWKAEKARVGLEAVSLDHPCAAITGTDNLFSITTERYADKPIRVLGPGAGREVTAGGMYADIRRALSRRTKL